MKSVVSFVIFVVVAYKVIFFVMSLLDAMNKCGALEFCK